MNNSKSKDNPRSAESTASIADLYIHEPPLRGSLTVSQVAQHLGVSEDVVRNQLENSICFYETSDHIRHYHPGSVEEARERMDAQRRRLNSWRVREEQKVRDGWSEALRRVRSKGKLR